MVYAAGLAEMLSSTRDRLKFVALSACHSAAATEREVKRLLESLDIVVAPGSEPAAPRTQTGPAPAAVAHLFSERLGCPVLGMRYAVEDDFAVDLMLAFYDSLFDKGQTVAGALRVAMRRALPQAGSPAPGALSAVTPVLLGGPAPTTFRLLPPAAQPAKPVIDVERPGMAHFPAEPGQFVGRGASLRRGAAAFAPASRTRGVVFYGMAGAGKSSCALELAYRYRRNRFSYFVWFKAPHEGGDTSNAFLNFVLQAARQAPGLDLSHAVGGEDTLERALPLFKQALEEVPILFVLDNLESLLDDDGEWRDRRWGLVVRALVEHEGLSRFVMTSRRKPRILDDAGLAPRVAQERVYALSLGESVLLARELPNLGRLLRGAADGVEPEAGLGLVRRVLEVVQGHPKLMELAERLAASPGELRAHLDSLAPRGACPAQGSSLDEFFRFGETRLEAREMLEVLRRWTSGLTVSLTPQARAFFLFLCCLEDEDRVCHMAELLWPQVAQAAWRRGADVGTLAEELGRVGLIEAQQEDAGETFYRIHPSVVEAGRAGADEQFVKEVGAFVTAHLFNCALGLMGPGGGHTTAMLDVTLRLVPYLMRLEEWESAASVFDQILRRGPGRAELEQVVPVLRVLVEATRGRPENTMCSGLLADALQRYGRADEAVLIQRRVIAEAAGRGDFLIAWSVSCDLAHLLHHKGEYGEAMAAAGRAADFARRAGLGDWAGVMSRRIRLQVLSEVAVADGRLAEEAYELYEYALGLEPVDPARVVEPYAELEHVINFAANTAITHGQWQHALGCFTGLADRREARSAHPAEIAHARLGVAQALSHLGRDEEVRALLTECKTAFEDFECWELLAVTHDELANVAAGRAHWDLARRHLEQALKLHYLGAVPHHVAQTHFRMALFLARAGVNAEEAWCHFAAGGLILLQTGFDGLEGLAPLFLTIAGSADARPPTCFNELCDTLEGARGIRFRHFFGSLPPRHGTGEDALAKLLGSLPSVGVGRISRRRVAAAFLLFWIKTWLRRKVF
ncbi:MAG TPA: hypothetical protein VF570_14210 [Pyrinomonadaceae bacterium]